MRLTLENVGAFMIERQHVAAADLLNGDVQIVDASRKNTNFSYNSEATASFFVKQGDPGNLSVKNEADFLDEIAKRSDAWLRQRLPRRVAYHKDARVLVTRRLDRATVISDFIQERSGLSRQFSRSLGRLFRKVHAIPVSAGKLGESDRPAAASRPPWVLTIHRPTAAGLSEISQANLDVIKILQSCPDACLAYDEVRREWAADLAIIHGDVKFDNCIVYAPTAGSARTRVTLVDWEMAKLGDPFWDVGSFFGELIRLWAAHSDDRPGDAPRADVPHDAIKSIARTFWSEYASGLSARGISATAGLHRSLIHASLRLVQTSYEFLQHSTEVYQEAGEMLQLAVNVAEAPALASAQILGLPFPEH